MDTTGAIHTLPLFLDRVAALSAELFGRDSAYPEEPVPTPTPRPRDEIAARTPPGDEVRGTTVNSAARLDEPKPGQSRGTAPIDLLASRAFVVALGALLLGYMFLGRGFAHVGLPPLYVGEVVLALGLVATGVAMVRLRLRMAPSRVVWLLLALMILGLVRTVPYLGEYGIDALRDATLWGYALFALMVFVLADRALVLAAFRVYGWVIPVFALWLPISWNLFAVLSRAIDPNMPGSTVPLVFFKGGDMAVHTVGAIAFLVLGTRTALSLRTSLGRVLVVLPLLWTAFVAGTSNRGALLTAAAGIGVVVMLAPRSRNWLPIVASTAMLIVVLAAQGLADVSGQPAPTPAAAASPVRSGSPTPSSSGRPSEATTSVRPTEAATSGDSTDEPEAGDGVAVANSGFELGPLNNGTIEGWTPRGAGAHNIVAGGAYRGARSASVQNVADAYEDTLTSSRIAFDGGRDIAVSVWVKAIAARPILEIYVNWYDRSGTLISSTFLASLATDGVRAWQEGAGILTAPANTTEAEITLYEAAGRATIGIDEITVRVGDFIPDPVPPKGRPATLQQMIDNILSVFGSSSEPGLEGTKQFRLAWWGKIVDYTVFGEYFWTGKGFGVNLADDDGFQETLDRSLRAPHNSHMSVLARMGVPGFILWLLVQGAFGIGLLRATLNHRRAGDAPIAAAGAWIFAYWIAMLVDTSFDPYLEGPQGGIWFWVVLGMGLVVMSLSPRRREA